jgi:hypothetical protein
VRNDLTKLLAILALVFSARIAHADSPFFEAGFGPASSNLQLAVTVDAGGKVATFKVKNTGDKPVTFFEAYSCSGPEFSISTGASDKALDHHYTYEPEVHGLTTQAKTACTRNVPIKPRTVAKGATVEVPVPFATASEITKTTDKAFMGNASLEITGRTDLVVLHSAVVTR